jgi:anti-sigma factor RsiW
MSETEFWQNVAAYADGELTGRDRDLVEARLAEDSAVQAAVARWQALRSAANRVIAHQQVPPALRDRIVAQLAGEQKPRIIPIWRISGTVLAAAAALILAIVYGIPGTGPGGGSAQASAVAAADLAKIYRMSACAQHIDCFKVAGMSPAEAARAISQRPGFEYVHKLPDFADRGFVLAGATDCPRSHNIPGVHVYFERKTAHLDGKVQPEEVVSFFSMSCQVALRNCDGQPCMGKRCCPRRPDRQLTVARTGDAVNVLKWDEPGGSFAVASQIGEQELVDLVETVDVAALFQHLAPQRRLPGEWPFGHEVPAVLFGALALLPMVGLLLPLRRR